MPSPRSAHCEEATADTHTNQTQTIWKKKKVIQKHVSKSGINAFILRSRCLIQKLQAILALTSSVSRLFIFEGEGSVWRFIYGKLDACMFTTTFQDWTETGSAHPWRGSLSFRDNNSLFVAEAAWSSPGGKQ